MKTINLQTVVYQEGKFWVSQCLNVDVSSFGKSEDEALNNLYEALELYFEDIDQPEISKGGIPEFKNPEDEAKFWDTQDSTKYVDWSNAEKTIFPNLKSSIEHEINLTR